MDREIQGSSQLKTASAHHIARITLDEASINSRTPEIEHERTVAIHDLVEWNNFEIQAFPGPYALTISTAENRINFLVTAIDSNNNTVIPMILSPFRSIIRDYFLICESYFDAVKTGNLPRIEAIDMSRRGLHNEGADLLQALLMDRVILDSETARRMFTLVCALHLK